MQITKPCYRALTGLNARVELIGSDGYYRNLGKDITKFHLIIEPFECVQIKFTLIHPTDPHLIEETMKEISGKTVRVFLKDKLWFEGTWLLYPDHFVDHLERKINLTGFLVDESEIPSGEKTTVN